MPGAENSHAEFRGGGVTEGGQSTRRAFGCRVTCVGSVKEVIKIIIIKCVTVEVI